MPLVFLCDKNPGTLITLYILLHIMNITVGNGNSVLIDRNIYYRGKSMGNKIDEKRILELVEKYKNAKFLHNGRSLEEGIDCLGFIILFYRDLGGKSAQ